MSKVLVRVWLEHEIDVDADDVIHCDRDGEDFASYLEQEASHGDGYGEALLPIKDGVKVIDWGVDSAEVVS